MQPKKTEYFFDWFVKISNLIIPLPKRIRKTYKENGHGF